MPPMPNGDGGRSGRGWARLGETLDRRIGRSADALTQQTTPDFGTIQGDMSLLCDRFTRPIPEGQYDVSELFDVPDPETDTNPATVGDHGGHAHTVARPDFVRPLAPGDRVVVLWMHGGADAFVAFRVGRKR